MALNDDDDDIAMPLIIIIYNINILPIIIVFLLCSVVRFKHVFELCLKVPYATLFCIFIFLDWSIISRVILQRTACIGLCLQPPAKSTMLYLLYLNLLFII